MQTHVTWTVRAPKCCKFHRKWEVRTQTCCKYPWNGSFQLQNVANSTKMLRNLWKMKGSNSKMLQRQLTWQLPASKLLQIARKTGRKADPKKNQKRKNNNSQTIPDPYKLAVPISNIRISGWYYDDDIPYTICFGHGTSGSSAFSTFKVPFKQCSKPLLPDDIRSIYKRYIYMYIYVYIYINIIIIVIIIIVIIIVINIVIIVI